MNALRLADKFEWSLGPVQGGDAPWVCWTFQCHVEIWPRPSYCDRGAWIAYVIDPGYPVNPNPFDAMDGFPRYYFDLERAQAEIEALLRKRHYAPARLAENVAAG